MLKTAVKPIIFAPLVYLKNFKDKEQTAETISTHSSGLKILLKEQFSQKTGYLTSNATEKNGIYLKLTRTNVLES